MSSVSSISGSTPANTQQAAQQAVSSSESDFLNLLVAQLKAQDPMNPMSNQDFLAQLAQFNSLSDLNTVSKAQQSSTAASLIGRTVTGKVNGTLVSGVVSSVDVSGTTPVLTVNGSQLSMDQLQTVGQ